MSEPPDDPADRPGGSSEPADEPGRPERGPLPDGEPTPVELPDFESSLAGGELDWQDTEYTGMRRRRRSTTKKKKHWYRPRNTLGIPAAVIVLLLIVGALYVNAQMSGIRRAPLEPDFLARASAGTNVLLVASRSPAGSLAADPATMVIQLVHLSADGSRASVVNLPSDLYLPEPGSKGTSLRLVDLYRSGGVPLVGEAVQSALDLTVHQYAQIGYAGYVRVTDRLGGVDMPTKRGARHFTGAQAEEYTTDASATSIELGKRNQQWLKAILTSALTPGVLLNPFTMVGLLKDTKPNLVLDDTFSNRVLRGLLWKARHLRPSSIRYVTVPYRHYATRVLKGKDKHGKVVRTKVKVLLPDVRGLRQLGGAVRTDNDSGVAVFGG